MMVVLGQGSTPTTIGRAEGPLIKYDHCPVVIWMFGLEGAQIILLRSINMRVFAEETQEAAIVLQVDQKFNAPYRRIL